MDFDLVTLNRSDSSSQQEDHKFKDDISLVVESSISESPCKSIHPPRVIFPATLSAGDPPADWEVGEDGFAVNIGVRNLRQGRSRRL